MAPPATKRRKLEHGDSDNDSEGSFADFDQINGVELNESDAEVGPLGSDESMDSAEDWDGDEDLSEDEEEAVAGEQSAQESNKHVSSTKASHGQKQPKRPATALQDGVYTAETFKSNVFKLQVDELLEQVKPKYGKKEAPAENAMRTLKNLIEQIPSRDPLPVRTPQAQRWHVLIVLDTRS